MIELILPFPPQANNLFPTGANGRRYKSATYTAWCEQAGYAIPWKAKKVITGPYALTATFDRPDRRRRDLGNLEKALSDLLVSTGVVSDDSLAQRITLQWSAANPAKGARVHVAISPCVEV